MSDVLNLPVAQSAFDRDYLMREDPELFDLLWKNPLTKLLVLFEGKTLLKSGIAADAPELRLLRPDEITSAQLRVYLGKSLHGDEKLSAQTPIVLAVLGTNSANLLEPDQAAWHQIRRSGAGLNAQDAELFSVALAMANWHQTHMHCPKCGTPTLISKGGWVRTCFNDSFEVFPRTDPAIIVSVIDDQDRILLGSQGAWGENRWSVLAGFVEPGEALEHAVAREVFEEAGVKVTNPVYLGSQAWPYPHSLMLGFTARLDPNHKHLTATPDGIEISKLRWFSRNDLIAEAGQILLPSKSSISRALIEHWFGGPLPTPEAW